MVCGRAVLGAALLGLAVPALAGPIVLNEVHYAPRDKTVPEEFIELLNDGGVAVDLGGWFFSDGIDFTFGPGTSLAPGEHLVVAQDPAVLRSRYPGIRAVGPFTGRLDNLGERIALRNQAGVLEDQVEYRLGFPWPTLGGDEGYSMELIHPDLDNDLGGSWRASNPGLDASRVLVAAGARWRYLKGTDEASTPRAAWRGTAFDDGAWPAGSAPIGYGENFIATPLADMQGAYSTVYLRLSFTVDDPAAAGALLLEARYDDGFNAWVNGVHVASANVPSADMAHDGTASAALEELDFNAFPLPPPAGYLVAGTNVLAVELHNSSLGGSSDAFFDARLSVSSGAGSGPTPGAPNSVRAANAPPQLRQVEHAPLQPPANALVLATVKVTDPSGVRDVVLEYQVVEPGSYIQLEDPEYAAGWIPAPMNDAGAGGDAVPGDGVYTVLLPRSLQVHRRLVRYRIRSADASGLAVTAPYPDDPSPNFAYFVHDGVPEWSGAIQPGSSNPGRARVVTYPPAEMGRLPVFHLITRKSSAEDATWFSQYGGDAYPWRGTLVHRGKVYDHIAYRARGGVWRYAMGKNMWKFNFLRGRGFQASDDHGRPLATPWDKLNFSAVIQQGDYLHRGEQGLFEAAGFKLFNLAGVEASKTSFATFRIIDEARESGPSQYDGDFWGLYLVIEQMDGRFLDEHGLPDGNFYKMEGGTGELNNLGPTGARDKSDLNAFLDAYTSTTPADAWWRDTVDLDRYYGYRAIVEAIHHYDIGYGKNYFYYLHPETNRWSVLPWDLDLTWADNMFGNGDEPFKSRVLSRAAFSIEYRNRMRQVRDLLYNSEQVDPMIDEFAAMIEAPSGEPSIADADRARWDYNPLMIDSSIVNLAKAGHGRFYQQAATRDFPGMVRLMKDYVASRGAWIDAGITNDGAIPRRPVVTSTSPAGFPLDRLSFESSAFSDPQGPATFAAMEWRAAEVTPPGAPAFDPAHPRLFEIDAAWESGEIGTFASGIVIPPSVLKVGSTYRVRARMKDATGRWSRWSPPVEFTAGPPATPFPEQVYLRVTEIMFHPPEGAGHEFIELQNTGPAALDLRPVSLEGGVRFRFAGSDVEDLGPGEHVVVVEERSVFALHHDAAAIQVAGQYEGRFDNAGDRVILTYGANSTILDFDYRDDWVPLADGGGHSLVIMDPRGPAGTWGDARRWRESLEPGGSPGAEDGAGPPPGGRQTPGDSNQDGSVDVSDAISFLRRLFAGAGPPPCEGPLAAGGNLAVLDLNLDGAVDLTDPIHLLAYLFQEGPAPLRGAGCGRVSGCPPACGF